MTSLRKLFFAAGLITVGFATQAQAQTGAELLLKPFDKDLRLDMTADAWITDTGHAKGTGTDETLQVGIAEVEGRVRLNPGVLESPRIGFGMKYFNIDSDIDALPNHLFDQSIGFAMPVGEYEKWIFGVSGAIGYAGQSPFGDSNAWYGRASFLAFRQFDETSGLAIVLDYDGNRTFKPDVPLPGFAYFKRISETLSLSVGLPVTSIEWQPIPDLRLELSYVLIENITARVGYTIGNGFEVFGALGQRTDTFFLDDQEHSRDRLIFQQRRAEVGVTLRHKKSGVGDPEFDFTAAIGYAFNGEFSVGFDANNSDLIADMSDEPYIRFGLDMKF